MNLNAAITGFVLCALLRATADTLTTTTGETLTGTIAAEADGAYQLRMANDDFSITYVRVIPTNEVASVVRDTPQQKAARASYETICRYRLQADREQTTAQCERAIATMKQFLQEHPDNPFAPRVRATLPAWEDELAHINRGEAKFQNRWMTLAAKQTAVAEALRQARLQTGQATAENLRTQIAKEEAYRTEVANALNVAERNLAASEQFLANLRDYTEPTYEYRPVGGYPQAIPMNRGYFVWSPPFWEKVVSGEKVVVNPQRGTAEKRVRDYQTSVNEYRSALESTNRRLVDLRAKLTLTEAALAKDK